MAPFRPCLLQVIVLRGQNSLSAPKADWTVTVISFLRLIEVHWSALFTPTKIKGGGSCLFLLLQTSLFDPRKVLVFCRLIAKTFATSKKMELTHRFTMQNIYYSEEVYNQLRVFLCIINFTSLHTLKGLTDQATFSHS